MLKISATAFIFSIAIHLLLYFFISQTVQKPRLIKNSRFEPIKGYLYQRPAEIITKKQEVVTINDKVINDNTPDKRETNLVESSVKNNHESKQTHSPSSTLIIHKKNDLTTKKLPEKVTKLSAFKQLEQLRSQLKNKQSKQHMFTYDREKTGSLLNAPSIPVTKSVIKQTEQQYALQNTTHYGNGLSIKKNKNGSCTVISDLSNVGIEGVTARSYMACGETKDDKNYRLHMDKVLRKLGKK